MKVRAHIRVAKSANGKYVVGATKRPTHKALVDTLGGALPTVAFAIDLIIPDEMFKEAERVIAEIEIPPNAAEIAAEVRMT